MSNGIGYLFGQLGSIVLPVSPTNFLPTTRWLFGGAVWWTEMALTWYKHCSAMTKTWECYQHCCHHRSKPQHDTNYNEENVTLYQPKPVLYAKECNNKEYWIIRNKLSTWELFTKCQRSSNSSLHLHTLQVLLKTWVNKGELQMWNYSLTTVFLSIPFFLFMDTLIPGKAFLLCSLILLHISAVLHSSAYLSWLLTDYSKCSFKGINDFPVYIQKLQQFHLSTVLNFTALINIWNENEVYNSLPVIFLMYVWSTMNDTYFINS